MADVVCAGFACVDVQMKGFPVKDNKPDFEFSDYIHFVQTELSVGGDALNEAMALAKLGCDAQLMTGFGSDNAGMFLRTMVQQSGVDMSPSVQHPTAKTGISTNLLQADGERYGLAEHVSDAAYFDPDIHAFQGARVVTLGSLFYAPFDDPALALRIVCAAKQAGAVVCADVMPPEGKTLASFAYVLKQIDYFFPNEVEAHMLTGETEPQAIVHKLLSFGIGTVILTLGPKGICVANQSETFTLPSFPVEVVDTTGAGDSFLAGFTAGLLDGKSLRDCCLFATATAACNIGSVGATAGIRDRAQVEACLARYA